MSSNIVLSVKNLAVSFLSRRGTAVAVDHVSFDLFSHEVLGLVGESGAGKSVTALAIVGLVASHALLNGEVIFEGENLLDKSEQEFARYRGKHIAMVLQDPLSALNPVLTIGEQLYESLQLHQGLRGQALRDRAVQLLKMMRIPGAEDRLDSYPHQLSGGMRQRVVGAIALAGEPKVLIADEPTTALDATVQAAYLELLKDVQHRTGVSILYITHDFGVVGDICDRVAVMYAGRIVETALTERIFEEPRHPYTKALLQSVPDVTLKPRRLVSIPGSPPSALSRPTGCRFHPRCWLYQSLGAPERCRTDTPLLTIQERADHVAACHFASEVVDHRIETDGLEVSE